MWQSPLHFLISMCILFAEYIVGRKPIFLAFSKRKNFNCSITLQNWEALRARAKGCPGPYMGVTIAQLNENHTHVIGGKQYTTNTNCQGMQWHRCNPLSVDDTTEAATRDFFYVPELGMNPLLPTCSAVPSLSSPSLPAIPVHHCHCLWN